MSKICKTYRNEQGASLAAALLFFMLCTVVAASVLLAASTAIGTQKTSKEYQQKLMALSSGAKMAAESITNSEYYGSYSYTLETTEGSSIVERTLPGQDGIPDAQKQKMTVQVPFKKQAFTIQQKEGIYQVKPDAAGGDGSGSGAGSEPGGSGGTGGAAAQPMFAPLFQQHFEYWFNQRLAADAAKHYKQLRNFGNENESLTVTVSPTLNAEGDALTNGAEALLPGGMTVNQAPDSYTFMLDVDTSANTNAAEFSELSKYKVKLEITFPMADQNGYEIKMIATLMAPKEGAVDAVGVPTEYVEDLSITPIVIDLVPAEDAKFPSMETGFNVKGTFENPTANAFDPKTGNLNATYKCGPMRWTINYVE